VGLGACLALLGAIDLIADWPLDDDEFAAV
jgi:hypothetical protein